MVRLTYKITLTYILVISVVMLSIAVTAGLRTPAALERHIEAMEEHVGVDEHLVDNLRTSFIEALKEILAYSVVISTAVALILAMLLSKKLVTPIQAMSEASRRIADGQFRMRVDESGNDELADLAHSFNQMAQELELTEKRRLRLIGDVAHELRTPLSGIISIIEAVSDGVLPSNQETFDDVLNEANRLKRLVNDLEELSRLSGDHVEIKTNRFNLNTLIEEIIRRIYPQFEGKGVELQYQTETLDNAIHSDPNRLTQIIHNLLSNALRYTPEGGRVTVHLSRDEKNFNIIVEDTGIGIPKNELNRIFERFYRVDA
ncbi:MAG: HAMP domain-containing protein, partial [Spirochaetaceae bacterium]|nr:HAMP domain-containing protein [Spirochaetaceae bacterium]